MARRYIVRINSYRDYGILQRVSKSDWLLIAETGMSVFALADAYKRPLDTTFTDAEDLVARRLLRWRNVEIIGAWEDYAIRQAEFQLTELGRRAIADFEERAATEAT